MGKSSPSPPPAPDAKATAQAQGQANTSTAAAQTALNLVNQNTPYGSTTYTPTDTYTTPDGLSVPRYTQDVQLSPMGQAILGGQQDVANTLIPAAKGLAGQVAGATSSPLNFDTAFSDYLNKGPQQINDQAADAIYRKKASFLDPQWGNEQQKLEAQLSRQGIPVGSEAYNSALEQLTNSRTQAYDAASSDAIAGGSAAASNLFGIAQAGQNQNIQQQQLAQQQPISLLSQLFGASPSTPTQPIGSTSPTAVSPIDITGATALQNKSAMDAYQAQVASNNATTGGVAGALGTAAMAAAVIY